MLAWAWRGAEMKPMALVEQGGNILTLIADFFPPDFTDWRMYVEEMIVTLHVAIWGTLLAVICAVPLGIMSSENIAPWWICQPVRRLMDAARAINEMVFAMMFVVAVGLGPFAGVLALWVHTTGTLAKLFSEAVEAIEVSPVEGVRSTGASFLEEIIFGVIPQVFPVPLRGQCALCHGGGHGRCRRYRHGAVGTVPQLQLPADVRGHGHHRAGGDPVRPAFPASAQNGAVRWPPVTLSTTPPHKDEPLYRLMAPLFGRDCRDGSRLPGGPVAPAGVEHGLWTSLAKTPAHYGLHATLKAPFELRSTSEGMLAALKNACRKVAERHASWLTAPLGLQRLPVHSGERQASFLALVPRQGDSASESAMAALERDCVTELDRFRAPLDQRDVERREPLSLDERRNLLRWGYHHVLDLFRFYITLTGPLPHEGAEQVEAALNQYLEPVIDKPLAMDSVCLFCQADRALPFRLTTRFALARTGNA